MMNGQGAGVAGAAGAAGAGSSVKASMKRGMQSATPAITGDIFR